MSNQKIKRVLLLGVLTGNNHNLNDITRDEIIMIEAVDYMVGAQLEGFETMVHLTEENEFIVLEGDEYLTSPIDRRPKFHCIQTQHRLVKRDCVGSY